MENSNQRKVIDIKPISKWKRILVFLGDFFITTILGFFLFNIGSYHIAKEIIQYDKKIDTISECLDESNDMLVESGFLFYPREEDNIEKDLLNSIDYTYNIFISYYLFDEETPTNNNPQLGHKECNEIFRTYYLKHKNKPEEYLSIFKSLNVNNQYFEIGDTVDSIQLKSIYKNSLANEYLELTKDEKLPEELQNIKNTLYEPFYYNYLYEDILENDLIINEKSYKNLFNTVLSINSTIDWSISISALITGVLSCIIIYLVYPLIQKEHRTPTMSIMKVDRLLMSNLNYTKKRNVLLQTPFNLIFSLGGCLYYPFIFTGVTYIFNLPLLIIFTLISLIISIVSLIVLLFNQYCRSGSDILSFTVLVSTSELDKLYTIEDEATNE